MSNATAPWKPPASSAPSGKRNDTVVVKAEIFWSALHEPKSYQNGPLKYSADFCNLSPEAVAKLAAIGVKTRTRDDKADQGTYLTISSTKYPPAIVDRQGLAIDQELGNGTKVLAEIGTYENSFGKFPTCFRITVTDLVEREQVAYEPLSEDDAF